MKKIIAAALLLGTTSALASCPTFATSYKNCVSTSNLQSVDSVRVLVKDQFYRFTLVTKHGSRRINIIADGEPRDQTIQTQDGSEVTYTDTASCSENQLTLTRTVEESSYLEQMVFSSDDHGMTVSTYKDGALINRTRCYLH